MGTFFTDGNAEIGITTERPSCRSTWNFPLLGNDNRFILGVTSQYPSFLYMIVTLYLFFLTIIIRILLPFLNDSH